MAVDMLSVRLLGGFVVQRDAQRVGEDVWRLRKAKTVIKLLALAPNHALHREQVVETLWPEHAPAAARNNLNQVLHAARRALDACGLDGSGRLVLREEMLELSPDADLWVDVEVFERAAARARRVDTAAAYREALALYGGELLPEDRYESWTVSRRAALQEQALHLLAKLAAVHRVLGDDAGEIEVLHETLALDALAEPAHRDLMRAFVRVGRRQQALAQFQRLCRALKDALAADPEPETRALYRDILLSVGEGDGGPAVALPPMPSAEHGRGNLRPGLTSFVGRERERAEVAALLERERLVTLTGAGGSGKTRLASEVAGAVEPLSGGAWMVELQAVPEGELVAQAVARTLGGQVQPEPSVLLALGRDLASRGPLLLLLDNCEHVVDECASLALDLLQACPSLTIMATSREPLRIPGEAVFLVPPLALPPRPETASVSEVASCEAVQLFVERATGRVPSFSLGQADAAAVAEICHTIEGIPLAIELAAAAIGALSPRQIADRLAASLDLPATSRRDRVARHETMRSALDWSHDLLAPPERVLFRRLSIFDGGFALEASEAVCAGDPIEPAEVLTALIGLVEKSLVQSREAAYGRRYRLLEPVRRYAGEKLDDAGERHELQCRHRDWYRALISQLDPRSAAGRPWALDRLEAEHENIRAALASGLVEDPDVALAIASAIWPFWLERGYFEEGARWLHSALSAGPDPSAARAEALLGACALDTRRGAFERRRELAGERLAILRRLGDSAGIVDAINEAGLTAWSQSDHRRAEEAFAEAMELALEIGDDRAALCVTHSRALLEGSRGELDLAASLFAEARALLEGVGAERRRFFPAAMYCLVVADEPWCPGLRLYFEESMLLFRRLTLSGAAAYIAANLANVARARGSLDEALELSERAIVLADRLDNPAERAVMLVQRGNIARARGEYVPGRVVLEEACEIRRALSDRRGLAMAQGDLGLLEAAAGNAARARALLLEGRALFTDIDDVVGAAGSRLNLANVALAEGDREEARTLLYQSLEPAAQRGLGRMSSWLRAALAESELALGNAARGQELAEEARGEFEGLGDRRGLGWCADLELPKRMQTTR